MALSLSPSVSLSVPLGLTSPTQIRAGDWPVNLPGIFGLFCRTQRHWAAMSPADKIIMSGSFALTSISSSI